MDEKRLMVLLENTITLLGEERADENLDDFLRKEVGFTEEELEQVRKGELQPEKNAGFRIVDKVQLSSGFGVVLGEKKSAFGQMEYVTWLQNARGFDRGHYYTNKNEAKLDFVKRVASELNVDLGEAFRNEWAVGDIESALLEFLRDKECNELMKNGDFMARAKHIYWNVDHSYENEGLRESMENLYSDMIKEGNFFASGIANYLDGKRCFVKMENKEKYEGVMKIAADRCTFWLEGLENPTMIALQDVKEIRCGNEVVYEKGCDQYEVTVRVNDEIEVITVGPKVEDAKQLSMEKVRAICNNSELIEGNIEMMISKNEMYYDSDEGPLSVMREEQIQKDLEMVQQEGWALEYVKEQTPEICMAAVQRNAYALLYVKEQTPELCAEAVKNDPDAWEFVDEALKEEVESLLDKENSLEYKMKEAKEINGRQAQSVVDKERITDELEK